MAERRMFTKKILDSDAFLDMPLSAQALYVHLNMRADDDGLINNPKKIQRMIGASEDDLKLLIAKRFVLCLDNGIIAIKHWRMHNIIRKDRYNPTQYQDELHTLFIKENGSYTEDVNKMATTWQPDGNHLAPQVRLGKVSRGKYSREGEDTHPSLDEVKEYFFEKSLNGDAEAFFDTYQSVGWIKANGAPIVDWKAVARIWSRKEKNFRNKPKQQSVYSSDASYDLEAYSKSAIGLKECNHG